MPSRSHKSKGAPGANCSRPLKVAPPGVRATANPRAIVLSGESALSCPANDSTRPRRRSTIRMAASPSRFCTCDSDATARSSRRWAATARRLPNESTRAITSRRDGTANSAAADGVAARTSATRSQIVTSTSCPTAEIVGIGHDARARATRSSLNAQRSSRAPPPRPMIRTSASFHRQTRSMAATSDSGAPSPCTLAATITISTSALRALATVMMSCMAAPSGLVITAIRRGNAGSARLREGSISPSFSRLRRVRSSAFRQRPSPSASNARTENCRSPRTGHTVICPYASTCIPSSGGAGMRLAAELQITHFTWASASRSAKYQCPLRCALKSLTSPRTHSGGNAPSMRSFAALVSVCTAIADSGALPGASSVGTGGP